MITRVITESDLMKGSVASPIVLDATTLITPAARDRAVRLGFAIVERDEARSEPGLFPSDAAGRALVAASGGALAVHRPAPGVRPAGAPSTRSSGAGCPRCGGACRGTCDPATRATCPHAAGQGAHPGGASGVAQPAGAAWTSAGVQGPSSLPAGTGDGLYLVRVEGGRIVSLLPAAGAGQMTRSRHP